MSKVDKTLVTQHLNKIDGIVREGKTAEKREQDGYTNEVLISDAKKILGLSEDSLLNAEFEAPVKKINLQVNSFINIANAREAAEKSELSVEILDTLKKAEKELAQKVALLYNLEVDELYLEGDE